MLFNCLVASMKSFALLRTDSTTLIFLFRKEVMYLSHRSRSSVTSLRHCPTSLMRAAWSSHFPL
jgi:hypothetical protein